MTKIQNLIFQQIKQKINILTGNDIDIDINYSWIKWEPNNDLLNGDVFSGTIYLKNDNMNHYDFSGIFKSFNEFDIKKLNHVKMSEMVKHNLI